MQYKRRYKEAEWVTPNRMKIETGHVTFDRQSNVVGTGNMIANTQLSFHIRPYSEVDCNGQTFPLGHLRDYDLNWFPSLPSEVRSCIESLTERNKTILYQFHHWLSGGYWGESKRIIHGYIITDYDGRLLRKLVTGPTYKSASVIDEMAEYVSW